MINEHADAAADPALDDVDSLTIEDAPTPLADGEIDVLPDIVLPQATFGRPVLSPDGTTIAIALPDGAGGYRLTLAPLDGGEPTTIDLALDSLDQTPAWSPDGSQLAIAAPHPADGRSAIWGITIQTGLSRILVEHDARDSDPVWSPDGEWIAYLSRRFGRNAASIVRSDGLGEAIQVSDAAPGFDDHSLTWARDSSRVAFARYAVDGDKQGDHIHTVDVRTGATKQVTTRLCGRHTLSWAPDRNLIIHVADDNEWDQIAVVNADNSSGWNVAAEKGDKYDPQWSPDGQRVTYLRRHEGFVRCCERGTSTANAETIDPGQGVASAPQFLPDKRVLYVYQSADAGPHVIVQEPKADAERTIISLLPAWAAPANAKTPTYFSLMLNDVATGALIYRDFVPTDETQPEDVPVVPTVIVLRDEPDRPRVASFDALEQALAATGMTVFVPTLAGTPGEGRKLTQSLAARVDGDAEVFDLVALVDALGSVPGVDAKRIAVVGTGHGGALALILAGSQPGLVQAVAAIDPLCDWNAEFDHASAAMRDWIVSNVGLPATNQGRIAVRTPATWAGIIDAPLLLMGTDRAGAGRAGQLDGLTAILRDLDRPFDHDVSVSESEWDAAQRVAAFIRSSLDSVSTERALVAEGASADAV